MKIGLLHFDLANGPASVNSQKLKKAMNRAVSEGVQWIVTPEMAYQGYNMVNTGHKYSFLHRQSDVIKDYEAFCKKHHVTLFLGCAFEEEHTPYNTLAVIDKEGYFRGIQKKHRIIPYATEEWATKGEDFTVLDIDGIRVGMLVCADAYYPEHAEILRDQGVEFIVCSAAWSSSGCGGYPVTYWRKASEICYNAPLIVSNQTGFTESPLYFADAESSALKGDLQFMGHREEECLLIVDYDPTEKVFTSTEFQKIQLEDLDK